MKTLLWWILKELFKNLGKVNLLGKASEVYRSGQPGFIRRRIMYWIIKPKTRINIAYSPNYDKQDAPERDFLEKKGVKFYGYAWSAGGPLDKKEEVMEVVNLLDTAPRPIWIGCEGGKDRTGGIIGYWKRTKGELWGDIIEDFQKYGLPAEGWLNLVFRREPQV